MRTSLAFRFALGTLLTLLTGCLVGPRYKTPQPGSTGQQFPAGYKEDPARFKSKDGWALARPSDGMLRGEWWRIYHDPDLNALENSLAINNQNVKQFFQNFMEARALVGEANAQLYPTITANASWSKSVTPASVIPITAIMSALNLSWEPDLWGRLRNQLRAQQYAAQVSAADLENERLTEQASLAVFFFELRGQDALIKLFNDTIAADKKSLDYTRSQYQSGITDKIALVEATNTLQNAEATATNLGVLRAQYEHAIAVLTGRLASSFAMPTHVLTATPPPIPAGIPSELLERRPDIAAAERTMAAANAQIGQAEAAYFPTLTLGSQGGFQSNSFYNLFDTHNLAWSYGPSASETVFDAGLRAATVRQFVATYNSDLAAYRQTVLTAFQQVEDNMAQTRIISVQLGQLHDAVKSAQENLELETTRYKTGIDPYVNVVTAETTLLTDQQSAIDAQIQEMTGSVQLIEALGGGWDRSQLPSPHDVSKWPTHAESAMQH